MTALVASFGDEKQTKPNPTKGKQTNQVRMNVDQKYKKLVTCINMQKNHILEIILINKTYTLQFQSNKLQHTKLQRPSEDYNLSSTYSRF